MTDWCVAGRTLKTGIPVVRLTIAAHRRVYSGAHRICTIENPLRETRGDSFGRFAGADRNVLISNTRYSTVLPREERKRPRGGNCKTRAERVRGGLASWRSVEK